MPDGFEPGTVAAPLVASPEDILATKLKAILDRAEAKDYRDISAMLRRVFRSRRHWVLLPKCTARTPAFP
jgi:predicted nucleotidyltransferase component of viral defense system